MKLKSLLVSLVILPLCPVALASPNASTANHYQASNSNADTKALQQQLDVLKAQVAKMQTSAKQQQLEQYKKYLLGNRDPL